MFLSQHEYNKYHEVTKITSIMRSQQDGRDDGACFGMMAHL